MFFRYIFLTIFFISVSFSSVLNTKHNLSTSGTGTIKGSSEQEVCAFCHIPHNSQPGKPLWNRQMPSSSYTMYTSTYLERSNYPIPNDLGSSNDSPGQLSRQCLSCHDGTIAIGGIYAIRGTVLGSALSVNDTNPDGTMKATASGYIGTDLRVHHPVGFEYDSSVTIPFGSGVKTIELKTTPTSPVKLYSISGTNYVECASCHDPHTENTKFLRVDVGNHGQNVSQTCVSCHQKDGWTGSAHQSQTDTYSDASVNSAYGTNSVNDLGCVNCHTPHNGNGSPYLLRQVEQNTCFKGASGSVATAPCHSSGGTKNIENVLSRTYGHGNTLLSQDNVHTNLDVLYGTGVSRFPAGSKGINWSDSKHVECMDCHNQHQSKAGNHRTPSDSTNTWYPASPSNLVSSSGPLTGATGVEPTFGTKWTQPTSFTTMKEATKEYQICMKCHSYWGLGVATNGSSSFATTSDPSINFTDQAWEFNKNNLSAHPVVINANSQASNNSIHGLDATQMKTPWKSVGTQTMMCSDCHGTDNEIGGDPTGPHGSSYKFMLKGEGNYWPTNSSGSHYRVGESYGSSSNWSGLFCQNCHNIKAGDGGQPHNQRNEMNGLYCVRCHSAVPHGSAISRLLAYDNWPSPYNYNGNMAKLKGYRKRNGYAREDAYAGSWNPPEAPDDNCSDKHDENSGMDSNPY